MTKIAEVVTIYERNARMIPEMLREAADSIETEASEECSPTKAMVAVQVAESGAIKVYGWGDVTLMDAIGALSVGAQFIGEQILEIGE